MGPQSLPSNTRLHATSNRTHPVLRLFFAMLVALVALGSALSAVAPAAADHSPGGETPHIAVWEEYYGSWSLLSYEWDVVFTKTDGTFQETYRVRTYDVGGSEGLPASIPYGEYWIEVFDPTGYYTVALDPVYDASSPFSIPWVDPTIYFMATPPAGYTPSGTNVTVEPEAGTTITFDNVSSSGITTVTVTETAPTLPEGYLQVGGLYYDVSTTATFDSATLCFSYDPTTVDASTLSLLHYENGAWVDVTTSNDTINGVICGWVTSFSPFALVTQAPVTWTMAGFHAPVTMTEGVFNTVQGGSAVPLKFNVYQDGVEVTDPAAVWVSITQIVCPGGATDPVDGASVTELGTELHYAGTAGVDGQFIQKWKTPKVSVTTCYQVTAGVGDATSVTTLFQLNP